jgi:hypothetical protein
MVRGLPGARNLPPTKVDRFGVVLWLLRFAMDSVIRNLLSDILNGLAGRLQLKLCNRLGFAPWRDIVPGWSPWWLSGL